MGAGRGRTTPWAVALAVAAALALGGCGGDDGGSGNDGGSAKNDDRAAAGRAEVIIAGFRFEPQDIVVERGGEVSWANGDKAPHTATSDDRTTFDTGTIRTGKREPLSFDQKGEFKYFCDFHPFMRGKVVVE